MRIHIVLFALGAWWLQRQPTLPDMRAAWLVALVLPLCLLLHARHGALRAASRGAFLAAAGAAGFFWAAGLAHVRLADALPAEWEGRDIEIVGVVATLPQPYDRSVRFELDVERVLTSGAHVPQRIIVSWWARSRDALPDVRPGQRWRFPVRLKRPHGMVNPHGFDYEAALLERGVRATGYVRPRGTTERIDGMVHRPAYWVEALRDALRERITRALEGAPYAGVIVALAVGDQRAIPPVQWQTFTRTGVNHLMSIKWTSATSLVQCVLPDGLTAAPSQNCRTRFA